MRSVIAIYKDGELVGRISLASLVKNGTTKDELEEVKREFGVELKGEILNAR